jgi:hypothetical protein
MLTCHAFSLFSMNILANIAKIQPQSYPSTLCHATLTFSVKKKKFFFQGKKIFLPGLLSVYRAARWSDTKDQPEFQGEPKIFKILLLSFLFIKYLLPYAYQVHSTRNNSKISQIPRFVRRHRPTAPIF